MLDFGLARPKGDIQQTDYVVTRWYRAPEIILRWMDYGPQGRGGVGLRRGVGLRWGGVGLREVLHMLAARTDLLCLLSVVLS